MRLGRGAFVVAVALLAGACGGHRTSDLGRGLTRPTAVPTTVAPAPATTVATTVPPLPPTTNPPPPTTNPPRPLAAAPAVPAGVDVYRGLGTWVDVYDWSATYGHGGPLVGPADVDRMAAAGVQTLFIQTSHADAPADVLEPERLLPIIRRARARGMRVVAWYLPTLVDPVTDLRRLQAAARLGVDGLAVDIEAKDVPDPTERNRRLLGLSQALRASLPGRAIGAIVLPPVVLDVINPAYWPGYPWAGLARDYDVWLPMAYWTFRSQASGWRDGYRYTVENVARLRQHLGLAAARVHFIGGLGDTTAAADVAGMIRADGQQGVVGGSLYDWRTTRAELWPALRALRR
jgi:hypothetical protein